MRTPRVLLVMGLAAAGMYTVSAKRLSVLSASRGAMSAHSDESALLKAFAEIQPIADAMERGGRKAAAHAVTDEVLHKTCAIAGTPDECIQRITEYRRAGCTSIMLEIWGDNREEQAKLFGRAVLPHFRGLSTA